MSHPGISLRTRFARAFVAGAAVLLLATACTSSEPDSDTGSEPSGGSAAVNEEARAALPDAIRDSGKLKVATSLTWAPFDYKDENGDPTGIEVDMIRAIADTLGVEAEITDIDWQSLVPSLSNGRFDVSMNQFEDTEERRQEVQFVHYQREGLALLTKKGVDIDPADLCGVQVAVTQGSSQQGIVQRISDECVAAGKPAIQIEVFAESAATILAVQNGRAASMLMGTAGGVYLQQTEASDLQVSEGYVPGTDALSGFIVAKDNDALAKALQLALQSLMADGTYEAILSDYGVTDTALEEITIGKE